MIFGNRKRRQEAVDRRVASYWQEAQHWSAAQARERLARAREDLRQSYRRSLLIAPDLDHWADCRARADVAQRRLAQLFGDEDLREGEGGR